MGIFNLQNLEKFNIKNNTHKAQFCGAVKRYMGTLNLFPNAWEEDQIRIKKLQFMKNPMQFFTTTGDFPKSEYKVIDKLHTTPAVFDNGWLAVFKFRNLTNTKSPGIKLKNIEDGIVFNKIPEGEKLTYAKLKGTEVVVPWQKFGKGLLLSQESFEDGDWVSIEEAIEIYLNKEGQTIPQAAYYLIESISSTYDITLQPPKPAGLPETHENYYLVRLCETLNKAGIELKNYAKQKGYTINGPLPVLCPSEVYGDIVAAINLRYSVSGKTKRVNHNFFPIETQMFTDKTKFYPCIPHNRIGGAQKLAFKTWEKFNSENYSFQVDGWLRFLLYIADQGQIRRCYTQ